MSTPDPSTLLSYISIPHGATLLAPSSSSSTSTSQPPGVRPAPKIATKLPRSTSTSSSISSPTSLVGNVAGGGSSTSSGHTSGPSPLSPTKSGPSITSAILATGLKLPAPPPKNPRKSPKTGGGNLPPLMSTAQPLSLALTASNFRRFVARSGPIFWIQDRVEEVLMWKRGWAWTAAWMAGYAFLCCFPRLLLLLPQVMILAIILSAYESRSPSPSLTTTQPAPYIPSQAQEGSLDWYSNLQGIQNLMGFVSDVVETLTLFTPHLTFSSPHTHIILTVTFVSTLALLPLICVIPLRPLFLTAGLTPFLLTHPLIRTHIRSLLRPYVKTVKMKLTRFADDDRLEDRHWAGGALKEVELFENERCVAGSNGGSGWSKANLRPGERKGWTRGRDGWSNVLPDGSGEVSTLTFALAPGWAFVETEDWRADLVGVWAEGSDSDDDGWIYSDDSWQPLPPHTPVEEAKTRLVTRRRRWVRRIYWSEGLAS